MRFSIAIQLLFLPLLTSSQSAFSNLPQKIAFGSCAHQDLPQPILDSAAAKRPDLFIWLDDNTYGDTKDMAVLKAKYDKLKAKPEFQRLKGISRFLATWDDHDYGWNDSGRHYPFKAASKKNFLGFWDEPSDSPRRSRKGIYNAYYFEQNGKRLQVILLDNRTFRDNLRIYRGELSHNNRFFYPLDYYPHEIQDSTLLGEAQWAWLENELRKPADLRIIGSGTQFSISYNGYEAWSNFPHERQRMLYLIKKTRANSMIFITGDVHYAEISVLNEPGIYPIYDITSSGITPPGTLPPPTTTESKGLSWKIILG